MAHERLIYLFSYGTLQHDEVQLATFGRKLVGEPDTLTGFRQTLFENRDQSVAAKSGSNYHLNIQFTGLDLDYVEGTRFKVTRQELEQADIYEAAADYKRINVQLKSGNQAWAYQGVARI